MMRHLIDIVALQEEADIPKHIYHGTSDISWQFMQSTDKMISMEDMYDIPQACSFTTSMAVAEWFARESVKRDKGDDAENGVVIVFDANKLRANFEVTHHEDELKSPDIESEEEIRVHVPTIPNISQYIVRTIPVMV